MTTASLAPDKTWIVPVARVGYVAKGVVYGVIAVLAISAAVGSGGKQTGATGALTEVAQQPFGRILVGVIAVGLASYAAWRWVQFFADPERKTAGGARGKATRGMYFVSALIHTALTVTAITLAVSATSSGGSGSEKRYWVGRLMDQPWGRWLIGVAGIVVIGVGLAEITKAFRGKELGKLDLSRLGRRGREATEKVVPTGLVARGVVFAVIGIQFVWGAVNYSPDKASGGTEQALQLISSQEFGWLLLLGVAVGLLCYGLLCVLKGLFRRFRVA